VEKAECSTPKIHCLPYRDASDNLICSTDKETVFLTYSSQECKIGGPRISFGDNFSHQRNWSRHSNSDSLRTKESNIAIGLGSQDSRGDVKGTYVKLRNVRAVRLNLEVHATL
jgi:hypothetical protein